MPPLSRPPAALSVLAAVFGLSLPAAPALAQSFEIDLAGKRLGRVEHAVSGGARDLSLTLDSTPLGVFDGAYAGRSVASGGTVTHAGKTRSSRKSRDVEMTLEAGRPLAVAVAPEAERTALTAPAAVPGAVRDPVEGFGALVETGACPDGLRIYDGRRVGRMALKGQSRDGDRVVCEMDYRVIAGPGYLEPLGLTGAAVELDYDAAGPAWRLERLRARSGLFALTLSRAGG